MNQDRKDFNSHVTQATFHTHIGTESMNTATILWLSLQVLVFSLLGTLVFVASRRKGPNAATTCAATVLGLTLPLAVLSVSPWPRWELPQTSVASSKPPTPRPFESPNSDAVQGAFEGIAAPSESATADAVDSTFNDTWRAVSEWLQPIEPPVQSIATPASTWRAWLPWLLIAGVGVGLVRFLAGILVVQSYRRQSIPVDDPALLKTVRELAVELQSAAIEVRETRQLRSAATIGWRRPLLLLPTDWPSWTETERRIVLAHELVHVARRDYLLVLLARLVTSIHFYQPLVLWLARQLRVQQELAADARAATVAGSRQSYLNTLAKMALRADEQPIPWAARAFLPSTSLLVRRITWLKRNPLQEQIMSRKSRWILATGLTGMVVLVAGIRGPNFATSTRVVAAETPSNTALKPSKAAQGDALAQGTNGTLTFTLFKKNEYVPADAKVVLVARPTMILEMAPPATGKILTMLNDRLLPDMKLTDLAEILLIKTTIASVPIWNRAVFKTAKAYDWKQHMAKLHPAITSKTIANKEYQVIAPNDKKGPGEEVAYGNCFLVPDDHTLVLATEDEMRAMLAGGEKLLNEETYRQFSGGILAVHGEGNWLRQVVPAPPAHAPNPTMTMAALGPLLERTERFTLSAGFSGQGDKPADEFVGILIVQCETDEGAVQVKTTLDAVRTLALNIVPEYEKRMTAEVDAIPLGVRRPDRLGALELIKIGHGMLKNIKLHSEGKFVDAVASIPISNEVVETVLLPTAEFVHEAARRNQSINNMRQLAIAMLNYAEKNRQFPPSAVLGKDGKTKHSWRVAILPYLEQQELYNAYHFDEPWDSEHNRKLIDRMPVHFRDPHMQEDSTSSAYYMITGKGTFGDSEKGRRFKEIVDGMSRTIMLVDAKRNFPWTKPEDIEIDEDPSKPLPELGGYLQEPWKFVVALADGSVRAIAPTVDEKVLRAYFTVNGHENAEFPLFNQ
jgi:beta-lactamase regulating signal transducer with metallopeptidase domain